MVKSGRQRQKEYRERHRDDPIFKEREKANKTRYLQKTEKRQKYNESAAKRMAQMRARKKEAARAAEILLSATSKYKYINLHLRP